MRDKTIFQKAQQFILLIYVGIMLGFFPICYHFQYRDMGDFKYHVFLISTVAFLLLTMFNLIFSIIGEGCLFKIEKATKLDWAMLVFFISNCLSFIFSVNQSEAFKGSPGWYTGFLMQLLLMGTFFVISKVEFEKLEKYSFPILLFSSFIVYFLAVLHRFNIDPLNIYGNLPEKYRVEFLSTMGQSSWYSSFLCTVWPLGLYLFYMEKEKKKRICYGIYTSVGAMSLVTQNTDTAFLSLAAILLLLFYISQKEEAGIKCFLESLILIFASFSFMGVLQRIFSDRMIPLEKLSIFMSQGYLSHSIVLVVLFLYLYLNWKEKGKAANCKKKKGIEDAEPVMVKKFLESRKLFYGIVAILISFIFLTIIFIILNTNGYLLNKFGYQIENSYLLFDENWGNLRGFSWKFSWQYFKELPLLRKVIGVGPDCYSVYYQEIPELYERVSCFFGGLLLTNSHNEYLTKLINLGILGLAIYIIMFCTAMKQFLERLKEERILGAFALITVSYMTHVFFCYEQVCCTPIFFILIAIGNKIFYNEINIRK